MSTVLTCAGAGNHRHDVRHVGTSMSKPHEDYDDDSLSFSKPRKIWAKTRERRNHWNPQWPGFCASRATAEQDRGGSGARFAGFGGNWRMCRIAAVTVRRKARSAGESTCARSIRKRSWFLRGIWLEDQEGDFKRCPFDGTRAAASSRRTVARTQSHRLRITKLRLEVLHPSVRS